MKYDQFLEIWVQRSHLTLLRAQSVSLFLAKAKYADLTSGRVFFSLPFSCVTVSDSVTLRVGILPQQGQLTGIPKAFETQDVLAAQ